MEAVLPRTRVKKKRRKPPGFWFWYWLFWVVWAIFWTIWDLAQVILGNTFMLIIVGIMVVLFQVIVWPPFRKEWDRWREDD